MAHSDTQSDTCRTVCPEMIMLQRDIANDRARISESLADIRDRLTAIERHLNGNGDDHPGIKIRLDRLEQIRKEQDKVRLLVIGAILQSTLSLVVAIVFAFIR